MIPETQVRTITYPESDGHPMDETGFHITLIIYLLSMLREYFRLKTDVYVGANMFVYYQEGDPTRNVAPDVFVVFGVSNAERRIWKVWEEGKAPNVVFELTSRSTMAEDLGTKKGLYEWLGVREYFIFDPLNEYLSPVLRGFRLTEAGYREVEAVMTADGLQLASDALGLHLRAEGGQLCLVDRSTGERLLPPPPELAEALRAAERRAEEKAAARQAAEARAEALVAELARLRRDRDV